MKNPRAIVASGVALLPVALATTGCCRTARDLCYRAISAEAQVGLDDCSLNLLTTVTGPASFVTETLTATETVTATQLFTETTTEIASTETLLFTTSTTVTAATETDIDSLTQTVHVTATSLDAVATVTTTSFSYAAGVFRRATPTSVVPDYAATACSSSWERYTSACKCAGAEVTTITIPGPVQTVTIPADAVVTLTASTLSSTDTQISLTTETVSTTETDIVSLTDTITTTQTAVLSATTTTALPVTSTAVVPVACESTGSDFRVMTPYPDGSTRWMNVAGGTSLAWQATAITSGTGLYTMIWTLDSNGYFQLANEISPATQVLAAYINLATATTASVRVYAAALSTVEANVAAGTWARIQGCVNPLNNEVFISGPGGRANILSCGNAFFLSTGLGTDVASSCVDLTPTASPM